MNTTSMDLSSAKGTVVEPHFWVSARRGDLEEWYGARRDENDVAIYAIDSFDPRTHKDQPLYGYGRLLIVCAMEHGRMHVTEGQRALLARHDLAVQALVHIEQWANRDAPDESGVHACVRCHGLGTVPSLGAAVAPCPECYGAGGTTFVGTAFRLDVRARPDGTRGFYLRDEQGRYVAQLAVTPTGAKVIGARKPNARSSLQYLGTAIARVLLWIESPLTARVPK